MGFALETLGSSRGIHNRESPILYDGSAILSHHKVASRGWVEGADTRPGQGQAKVITQ